MDIVARTSMIVVHRGGSMVVLFKVLSAFSRNVNLTKLEVINNEGEPGSPPLVILDMSGCGALALRTFLDVYYVDCEGAAQDPCDCDAIQEIDRFTIFMRMLRCYAVDSVYDLQ
jgi:arogenate/prephenate dehydratase